MGLFKNGVGRPSNDVIKKRNIFKGICLLFIIVIIILVCLLVNNDKKGTKTNNKKTTKVITTTKQNVNIKDQEDNFDIENESVGLEIDSNLDKEYVKDLFSPFKYYTHEASDEELYKKDKIFVSDLSDNYKNRLAYAKYVNSKNKVGCNPIKSTVLEEYYKRLFGKNIKYTKMSFNSYGISGLEMRYQVNIQDNIDEKNYDTSKTTDDTYYCDIVAGDYTYYRYGNELYKAEKNGNNIYLYLYVVVYKYADGKYGVYKNIDDADNYNNPIKQIDYIAGVTKDSIIDKNNFKNEFGTDNLGEYKNEASQYKITFEKEDNEYIFKMIEKIK